MQALEPLKHPILIEMFLSFVKNWGIGFIVNENFQDFITHLSY